MPTSAKPRRAQRRRHLDGNAHMRAIRMSEGFDSREQTMLGLPPRTALEAIRRGAGLEAHFMDLALVVNLVMIIGENAGPAVEAIGVAARDALNAMRARHTRTRKWGFAGGEPEAITAALDLYDQLLALLTAGELKKAKDEYTRRVSAGEHCGKVP